MPMIANFCQDETPLGLQKIDSSQNRGSNIRAHIIYSGETTQCLTITGERLWQYIVYKLSAIFMLRKM